VIHKVRSTSLAPASASRTRRLLQPALYFIAACSAVQMDLDCLRVPYGATSTKFKLKNGFADCNSLVTLISRLSSNFQACAPGRFIPTRKSALLTDMIFPSRTQIRRQTLSLFVLLSNEATNDSGRSEKRRRRSSSLQYAGSRINSSASEAGTSTTPVPP